MAHQARPGFRISESAKPALAVAGTAGEGAGRWQSLAVAFTTQASKPKPALVQASVISAFLPALRTPGFDAALLALVFMDGAGWYAIAGGIMVALDTKLMGSARGA